MDSRISKLIRTNTALVFLCVIAIGVFIMTIRKNTDIEEPVRPAPVVVSNSQTPTSTGSVLDQLPESSPLKRAPSPDSFEKFFYSGQATTSAIFNCNDAYDVLLIYPVDIEYRVSSLSSVYNRAFACTLNASTTRVIDLSSVTLHASTTYYLVRAHQGLKGSWYGPY